METQCFKTYAYMHAKLLQSCPTLCDPMDCSLPDSSVNWISQMRILQWIVISCSRGSSWTRDQTFIFCMCLLHCRQTLYPLSNQGSPVFTKTTFFFICFLVAFPQFIIPKAQTLFPLLKRYKVKLLSRVWLFTTPWTVAYQAPPSMGFSRQEYWSGLSFPSPGDLPDPGIKPRSPAFQAKA